jgi:hypothetical protein
MTITVKYKSPETPADKTIFWRQQLLIYKPGELHISNLTSSRVLLQIKHPVSYSFCIIQVHTLPTPTYNAFSFVIDKSQQVRTKEVGPMHLQLAAAV